MKRRIHWAERLVTGSHQQLHISSRSISSVPSTAYGSTINMSDENKLTPQFSPDDLKRINSELSGKSPQDILRWAIDNVQGLYQTTAFGL